ncbi:MAG: hypothetical protein V1712_01950 [Patescibacteria group bacterium]
MAKSMGLRPDIHYLGQTENDGTPVQVRFDCQHFQLIAGTNSGNGWNILQKGNGPPVKVENGQVLAIMVARSGLFNLEDINMVIHENQVLNEFHKWLRVLKIPTKLIKMAPEQRPKNS